MILFDAIFRYSGTALLIILALLAFRRAQNSLPHLFLCLSSISLAGLFMGYTPEALTLPDVFLVPARLLDVPHLVFIWLFALSLFEKDFRVRPWHWLVGTVFCLPIIIARIFQFTELGPFPLWATALSGVLSFGIALHMIVTVLLGRTDDMSSQRRASRVYFSAMIAFVIVAAAAIELILVGEWAVYLRTAKVLTIWPAIVWTMVWLVELRPAAFAFDPPARKRLHDPEIVSRLHDQLITEMQINKAYQEPDITILTLAKRLAVTQHSLREFINSRLGFKNFSDFINSYRIEAVKSALSDPDHQHKSVLQIALDNGFSSLSPFNRAFKNQVGLTPREFREAQRERWEAR